MKRERTKDFDVLRQGSTISIVERRSGVATSFILPSDEAREALIKILAEPLAPPATEKAPAETSEPVATESEPKKTTTTKKKTTTTKK
jgi:hypothetical protein